jgi:hypothetical protein
MNNIIYLLSFILSGFILYLFKIDLKKFKSKLYDEINNEIWIKVYSFICIGTIHLMWLLSTLLLNYNDTTIVYAFPYFLLIPYGLYIGIDLINKNSDNDKSIASEKIDNIFNYLISFYFISIIIFIMIPNSIKISFMECIRSLIHKYII